MHQKKLRLAVAACAAALALAAPAAAQTGTAPATAAPDTSAPIPASRLQAAAELIQAQQMEENYQAVMNAMMDAEIRGNPELSRFRDVMQDFFLRYMGWNQVKDEYARMYARQFTEDEMHQIAAFMSSPAGRHLTQVQPEMMREGGELAQRRLQAHMAELQQAIEQRIAATRRPTAGTYAPTGKKPVNP